MLRKILVFQILAILCRFWLKIDFLVYYSILAHYIFLIFCMKLETIKGYFKLTLNHFLRKILILQIFAIFGHFWLKIDFLVYCSILPHYIFFRFLLFFLFFVFIFIFIIFFFLFQKYLGSFVLLCLF